ncbi:hypothetical protein ACS0TY_009930 [Phlomoides rotata]
MSLYTNVKDLNPSRTFWVTKVRCIKLYEVPMYGGGDRSYNVECILHDREGYQIHGTIKKDLSESFRPLFQEGKLYAIKYFVVTNNSMCYKTTSNKYKIVFRSISNIVEITKCGFPIIMYDFKKFSEISNVDNIDLTMLVVSISPIQTKDLKDGSTKQMDVVLEDTERFRIACTLWGNFTYLLNDYVTSCGSEPVIVILQMSRQKNFRDQVNLSNTYYVSRMICVRNAPEVIEFKSKLVEDGEEGEIIH